MDLSSLRDRFIQIFDYLGLTQTQLAKSIGVKQQTINTILNGSQKKGKKERTFTNPSSEVLTGILVRYQQFSSEWLLRGEGQMLRKEYKNEHELKESAEPEVILYDCPECIKKEEKIAAQKQRIESLLFTIDSLHDLIKFQRDKIASVEGDTGKNGSTRCG